MRFSFLFCPFEEGGGMQLMKLLLAYAVAVLIAGWTSTSELVVVVFFSRWSGEHDSPPSSGFEFFN